MKFIQEETPKMATCLLLDNEDSTLLARGVHSNSHHSDRVEIEIIDGFMRDLSVGTLLQVIFIQKDGGTRLGQVVKTRGNRIIIDFMRSLDDQIRRNLRIPVEFDSYAYPINPKGGRMLIRSRDLSCGGISFYTTSNCFRGDTMEIVIPITAEAPIILKCEILRLCERGKTVKLYAAKFIDMINDEETRIRETVFSVQLRSRPDTDMD